MVPHAARRLWFVLCHLKMGPLLGQVRLALREGGLQFAPQLLQLPLQLGLNLLLAIELVHEARPVLLCLREVVLEPSPSVGQLTLQPGDLLLTLPKRVGGQLELVVGATAQCMQLSIESVDFLPCRLG